MVDKIMFRDNLSLTRKAFEIQILNFGQEGAFGSVSYTHLTLPTILLV